MHDTTTAGLSVFFSLAAFFTGLAKAGLGPLGGLVTPTLVVPLNEPRLAVSLATVLFIMGDVGAILYYLRKVCLPILLRLLPTSALGMLAAFLLGKHITTGSYLFIITGLSGLAFGLILGQTGNKHTIETVVSPKQKSRECKWHLILLISSGFAAGFTTVLGNASGIFMNLYLNALKLPKQGFIATMVMFYFLVNSVKLLVYYFYWQSLDLSVIGQVWSQASWLGLATWIWVLFSLISGLVGGIFFIHKMSQQVFSLFVVLASLASFLLLLWRTLQHFDLL